MRRTRRLWPLEAFSGAGGFSHTARLPADITPGDTPDDPRGSDLLVIEDGQCLGPAHAAHSDIAQSGAGRYSHWFGTLYFSASDGTDPSTNGRAYQVLASLGADPATTGQRAAAIMETAEGLDQAGNAYAALEAVGKALRPDVPLGEDQKLFWKDQEFWARYDRLCGGNRRSGERKYVVWQLVAALGDIAGDMAECGAYQGATAWFMADARGPAAARGRFTCSIRSKGCRSRSMSTATIGSKAP